MLRRGYVFTDGGGEYAAYFYAPGTTRNEIKTTAMPGGKQPVLKLRRREIEAIQDFAQTEDDIVIAAVHFCTSGGLPDPIQQRIEAAASQRTAALDLRIQQLEKLLAEREKEEDEELLKAEAAEAAAAEEAKKKPAKAK